MDGHGAPVYILMKQYDPDGGWIPHRDVYLNRRHCTVVGDHMVLEKMIHDYTIIPSTLRRSEERV